IIASSRTLSGRLFSCTYASRKEPTVSFEIVRTLRTVLIFSRPPRALMLLAITSSTPCARALTGNNATAAMATIGSTVRNIGTDSFPNAIGNNSTCLHRVVSIRAEFWARVQQGNLRTVCYQSFGQTPRNFFFEKTPCLYFMKLALTAYSVQVWTWRLVGEIALSLCRGSHSVPCFRSYRHARSGRTRRWRKRTAGVDRRRAWAKRKHLGYRRVEFGRALRMGPDGCRGTGPFARPI